MDPAESPLRDARAAKPDADDPSRTDDPEATGTLPAPLLLPPDASDSSDQTLALPPSIPRPPERDVPTVNDDPDATCALPAPVVDDGATLPPPTGARSQPPSAATAAFPATPSGPSLVVRDTATGSPSQAAATASAPGQIHIDGYVIEGELGRGGMGVVYKALQPKLRRTVAIKMIRAAGLASEENVARFYAEARAVAALQHVNIVQIYDIGESDTLPYFSLEFVPGSSLDKKLAKQPQPPVDAAEMVETLARAMSYAHQHGIVHRDLKPANVLLSEKGVPKITDFGLAKDAAEESGMSRDGQAMGTPSYMPPEQARGDLAALGPPADIYSLGAILYEMLVGRPPFLGSNAYDTLLQVLKQDPVAPSQLVPKLPKDVETICLKCLEKDPAKRYPSAADLAEDCRRYRAGEPILSRPISGAERAWRWCKRNPRVAGLLATVAGLLVTVAFGSSVAAMVILAERNAKEVQRQAAVKARGEAEEHERIAKENEKIATDQAELALGTLYTFVDKVQTQLDEAPRTQKLKRELLDTAIEGLDKVADKAEQTTSINATLLMAYVQYAEMYAKTGQTEKAIEGYTKCLAMAKQRAAEKAEEMGDHDSSQYNVAAVASTLGQLILTHHHDPTAALELFQQALAICEALDAKPRSVEGLLTEEQLAALLDETRTKIAALHYVQGAPAAARPLFLQALEARRKAAEASPEDPNVLLDLARSVHAVGEIEFLLGNRPQGFDLYDECLAIQEKLVGEYPHVVPLAIDLGITHGDYGDLCIRSDDLEGARRSYDRSVDIASRLAADDEENADAAHTLGLALYRRGQLGRREADVTTADDCFTRALAIREKIAAKDPSNVSRQIDLMLALAQRGECQRATGIAEGLPTEHGDREILLAMAKCFAICSTTSDADASPGYVERAIGLLKTAIAAGYRDATILLTDPDLAPVREAPGYPVIEAAPVPVPESPDA